MKGRGGHKIRYMRDSKGPWERREGDRLFFITKFHNQPIAPPIEGVQRGRSEMPSFFPFLYRCVFSVIGGGASNPEESSMSRIINADYHYCD